MEDKKKENMNYAKLLIEKLDAVSDAVNNMLYTLEMAMNTDNLTEIALETSKGYTIHCPRGRYKDATIVKMNLTTDGLTFTDDEGNTYTRFDFGAEDVLLCIYRFMEEL